VTRAQGERLLAGCRTTRAALVRSERVRRRGLTALAEALWARAMALRAVGYTASQEMYQQRAAEWLAEAAP